MIVTPLFWWSIFFTVISGLCMIVSYSNAYWAAESDSDPSGVAYQVGLWTACKGVNCESMVKSNNPTWFIVVQVFSTFALCIWVLILVFATIWGFSVRLGRSRRLILVMFILAIFGVLYPTIAVCVFAAKRNTLFWPYYYHLHLDWAFFMSGVSAASYFLTALFLLCYLGQQKRIGYTMEINF